MCVVNCSLMCLLWPWMELLKTKFTLHHGSCRFQHFWSLTYTSEFAALILNIIIFFLDLSLQSPPTLRKRNSKFRSTPLITEMNRATLLKRSLKGQKTRAQV